MFSFRCVLTVYFNYFFFLPTYLHCDLSAPPRPVPLSEPHRTGVTRAKDKAVAQTRLPSHGRFDRFVDYLPLCFDDGLFSYDKGRILSFLLLGDQCAFICVFKSVVKTLTAQAFGHVSLHRMARIIRNNAS